MCASTATSACEFNKDGRPSLLPNVTFMDKNRDRAFGFARESIQSICDEITAAPGICNSAIVVWARYLSARKTMRGVKSLEFMAACVHTVSQAQGHLLLCRKVMAKYGRGGNRDVVLKFLKNIKQHVDLRLVVIESDQTVMDNKIKDSITMLLNEYDLTFRGDIFFSIVKVCRKLLNDGDVEFNAWLRSFLDNDKKTLVFTYSVLVHVYGLEAQRLRRVLTCEMCSETFKHYSRTLLYDSVFGISHRLQGYKDAILDPISIP